MSAKLCVLLGFLALPMLPALRHEFSWRQVLAYVLMAVQPPRLRATLRMLQPGGFALGSPLCSDVQTNNSRGTHASYAVGPIR